MLRTKIYAIVGARLVIFVVLSILFVPFFLIYVVCMIGEWFVNAYGDYVSETKQLLSEYDVQLNGRGK